MAITKLQPFNLDATANYTFANVTASNVNGANLVSANFITGTLTTAAQPNITSTGSLTGLTVSNATGVVNFTTTANVTLGDVSNLHISGGTTGQYLQTDGSGTLTWSTVTSGSSTSISNGNSNVNIPTSNGNVNISAVGNANILVVTGTGANITGTLNVTGDATIGNLITSGSGGNISNVNVISSNTFIASGNITAGNANLGNSVTANYFIGNFYGTANLATYATTANAVAGANVSGQVSNALVAGTVYTAAQPNITSVGTLSTLIVSGNVELSGANVTLGAVSNLHISGGTNAYVLSTDGAGNLSWVAQSGGGGGGGASIANGTSNINIPNIDGNVVVGVGGTANVVTMTSAGNVNILGNIVTGTGLGGNITGVNLIEANSITSAVSITSTLLTGTITTNAQPNITSLGSLTGLTVSNASGLVDFTTTSSVTLGAVANLHISGGSAGFGLVTDGSGSLSFANITSVVTNNNTANATYYPVYATATSGNLNIAGISSTKMQFNPSSGQLTVTDLNTTSDAILKNNVESIDDPIAILRQMFGVGFNWVDTGKKSYGVIAQMLEKVLPELVNVNDQGTKTVSYIPIIAFLIEAVKRQQDDIDMLKATKR